MTKDQERAEWVASFAIAYTARLTDAQRLLLLGLYFDRAYASGVVEGIDRMAYATVAV